VENLTLPDIKGFKPASELVSPSLLAGWHRWAEMAGDRLAPSRKEIVPAHFKQVLDSIFLMEVVDDGEDFRFALGGQTLVRFMNGRHHGKLLSSLPPTPYYKGMHSIFARCVKTATPIAQGPFRIVRDQFNSHRMEVLVMPLSEDGASVSDLLGMVELKAESAR